MRSSQITTIHHRYWQAWHLGLRRGSLAIKSKQIYDLFKSNGIKQEFFAPYTPEENCKTEGSWGTKIGMTRCMLATIGVPKLFWPFALSTTIYLKNGSIHSAHGKTLFEMLHGCKLDFSHHHVFVCQSFMLNEVRKTPDSKAGEAILLRYSGNSKAYVVSLTNG